ncbi:MAG: hypothetical protein LBJ94_02605 [Puniceicoccales bacterium]|jgi:hypothetical protein|nr:hypothetical protein [Puniceicoccales bacterium]
MGTKFLLRIALWLALTIFLGIFARQFYLHSVPKKLSPGRKDKNRLGKAMVNIERACLFGDSVNFYEFAKYAIREAMRLPQGKVGLGLTLADIKANLRQKAPGEEIEQMIAEVYATAEQLNENEDMDVDLKSKLDIYCGAIRRLNDIYGE